MVERGSPPNFARYADAARRISATYDFEFMKSRSGIRDPIFERVCDLVWARGWWWGARMVVKGARVERECKGVSSARFRTFCEYRVVICICIVYMYR